MKKPLLLLLTFIPLISSCNKKGSFPNPFPSDTYNKTGFVVDEKTEGISRLLTTDETNIVLKTISAEDKDNNDNKITKIVANRETRDYTRAFAGEFKQGYNVKNVMKSENITYLRQYESDPIPTGPAEYAKRERTKVSNTSKTVNQYSYGQVEETIVQDDYVYYNGSSTEGTLSEAINSDEANAKSINQRTKKTVNGYEHTPTDEKLTDTITDISKFYLRQSDYISAPDVKSGADKEGNIVLVKASQNKHKDPKSGVETGVFELTDGRKYQAIDNSLTVTKLKIQKDKSWCLVTYVRVYEETVITSEVIQPNVPVTKLSEPITIAYSEEKITEWSTEAQTIDNKLPGDN